jgi:putative PIN family toxin of toxin-antitoxin system
MIAAVFDCAVYIQAALSSRGPGFACLSLAEEKQIVLHCCPYILDELKRTLERPSLRRKYASLTDARVEKFLERMANVITINADPAKKHSLSRDPTDEPYLDLTSATAASFLVSRDKDLLSLMGDESFRNANPGLSITDPAAFLALARATITKEQGHE